MRQLDPGVTTHFSVFDDEIDTYLEREDEIVHAAARPRRLDAEAAKARMSMCGTTFTYFSSELGMVVTKRRHCRRKDCPQCGKMQGYFLWLRVDDPLVQVSQLSHDDALLLRRALGMANYVNVPRVDDELVFWQPSLHPDLSPAFPSQIFDHDDYDWRDLQNTPQGKNISGRLNPYIPPEKGDTRVISPRIIVHDATRQYEAEQLGVIAALQTLNALPTEPDEVQVAIYKRSNKFQDLLDDAGITYDVVHMPTYCDAKHIDWRRGAIKSIQEIKGLVWNKYKDILNVLLQGMGHLYRDLQVVLADILGRLDTQLAT